MNVLYFIGAVLLYGAWGALVITGKAGAPEYVAGITAGLTWLAAHVTNKSARADSRASLVVPGVVEPLSSSADAGAAVEPAAVVAPAAVVSAAPAAVQ
ncbi:hypothetical protein GIY62_06075 [Burkholderia plantarii]|uniref:hypothetical protein n=1 Tax=Burkholderia plantarii TaxID=41899 RepID=UPI00272D2DF4|nr:hypothetical protein [Burkholderia plantarii]WLE60225.1 hypothetical protein GIY62_06075 [Burkholderia plantarii]